MVKWLKFIRKRLNHEGHKVHKEGTCGITNNCFPFVAFVSFVVKRLNGE
jgi:hypothetical protein